MILDANAHKDLAKQFEILNLDSGNFVRGVRVADDFTGKCEIYIMDEGRHILRDPLTGDLGIVTIRFNWVFCYKGSTNEKN